MNVHAHTPRPVASPVKSWAMTGLLALLAGGIAGGPRTAHAQGFMGQQSTFAALGSDSAMGAAPDVSAQGQDTGVRLGDGMFHLGLGAEGGYDSNVFYGAPEDAIASPLLRLTPYLSLTNQARDGVIPSGLYYDLGAQLQYREYLSNDPLVKSQRAFNPVASAFLQLSSNQTLSLALSDTFSRVEEPPFGLSTTPITRINNMASAEIGLAPGGGRITARLRYTFGLDLYEDQFKFASLIGHDLMLDLSWKWFPKTALFLQGTGGYIHYLNNDVTNPRADSYPVRGLAGLRGLITSKLSASVGLGYSSGFYQGGVDNPGGLSNLAGVIELAYQPHVLARFVLGFRHEFRNSVVGNFYDLNQPYAGLAYMIGSRLQVGAQARYEMKTFSGARDSAGTPIDRSDNLLVGHLAADYFMQAWLFGGVAYTAMINASNATQTAATVGALDYTKHVVMARVGIVY
jgi:hypothetical protein